MVVYGEGRYRCAAHEVVPVGPRDPGRLDRGDWEPACPHCGRRIQMITDSDLEQVQPVFSVYLSFSPSDLGADPHELALVRRPA